MSTHHLHLIEANLCIPLSQPLEISSVTDSIDSLLGFSASDFLSGQVNLQSRVHAHDQDIADELFSLDLHLSSRTFNIRLRHADGRIRCIKGFYKKTRADGDVMLELLLQDAKSLWHPSNDHSTQPSTMTNFKAMMDNTDDYIYFKDRNHVFNGASQSLVEITECSQHWTDFLGLTDYDVFLEEYADIYYSLEKQVFAGVNVAHDIQETRFRDGSKGWVNNRKYPIMDDCCEVVGLFGIAHNITEHRNLELELRKKESYQRTLLDNFPFAVWLKDTDSRFLSVNKGFSELFGEENPEALIGKNDFDITSHELAVSYRADDRQVMSLGQPKNIEEEILTDGVLKWFETYKAPLTDENEKTLGTVGFARDITKRMQAETDLRIAAIAFESQEGMMVTDANKIILRVNKAFTKITGYSADEIVGHTPKVLSSGRHTASFYAGMWSSLNATGSYVGEIWNKRKNGEIYPQKFTITAVTNQQGLVTHYVNTLVDITDVKQQEQDRLDREANLRDTLVREVHHRIKNNLQGVAGLLRGTASLYPALEEPLAAAISQVHSIALIHGLQGRNAISSILLCDLVADIASSQKSLWQTPIEINQSDDVQYYRIIETETVPLALVFNELIANAIKHGVQATGIQIKLSVQHSHIVVSIINMGKLSLINHEKYAPVAGTGLKLVASLLPRKGAQLSWQQHGDYVTTMLEITSPVITFSE